MKFMIAIAAFSLIVLVHELGHFLAARYFKVKVKNFSVGLGPILLSFSSGDTLFCLRAVPLGGFVDIDGMEEDSRFGFNIRPYYQKVLILFAGVFMNIILSFVAMFSISMYLGHIDETSNIITRSLSSEAILKVDDKVVEVNGKKIDLTITDDKIVWGDNPKPVGEGSSLKSTFDRYQGSLQWISAMDSKDLGFSSNYKFLRVKNFTCKKGKAGKLL